jgi:hypothetical protein
MTTSSERTRNILQAGAFLKELCADTSLPECVRDEANRLLRHYPTIRDVQTLAIIEAASMGSNVLTPQFDPQWCESYRLGPHAP